MVNRAKDVLHVYWAHDSRPDRAKGSLYVRGSRPGRAEDALYVQPTCLDVQGILCTVKAFEKFNLLIYWFQKSGITYPTLEMIKICPKRRRFDDKNDVFWMGFGFKIWRCDISSLEPVPHKHIGSTNTPITCSRIAWTCKESFASQNLDKCNVLIYWFQ